MGCTAHALSKFALSGINCEVETHLNQFGFYRFYCPDKISVWMYLSMAHLTLLFFHTPTKDNQHTGTFSLTELLCEPRSNGILASTSSSRNSEPNLQFWFLLLFKFWNFEKSLKYLRPVPAFHPILPPLFCLIHLHLSFDISFSSDMLYTRWTAVRPRDKTRNNDFINDRGAKCENTTHFIKILQIGFTSTTHYCPLYKNWWVPAKI